MQNATKIGMVYLSAGGDPGEKHPASYIPFLKWPVGKIAQITIQNASIGFLYKVLIRKK